MFVLNTIVADVLSEIADELEKAKNVRASAQKILCKIAKEHRRIIYNGDNYIPEWVEEAEKRGLANMRSTVESLGTIMDEENVRVFAKHKVLSQTELHARRDILFEVYSKMINIEALTMLNMAKRQILPAAVEYSRRLADAVNAVNSTGIDAVAHKFMLENVCGLINSADQAIKGLETFAEKCAKIEAVSGKAEFCRDKVIPAMSELRQYADKLEMNVDAKFWPLPTYAEMLFLK